VRGHTSTAAPSSAAGSAPYSVPYCLVNTAWMVIVLFIPIMPSWLNVRP
jgi:hypothetical protein